MICDHCESAAGTQYFGGLPEESLECSHLVVDFDAESLEHLGEVFFLPLGRDGFAGGLDEPERGVDRCLGTCPDDCGGQRAWIFQVGVGTEQPGQFLLRVIGEDVGRSLAAVAVHAHVKGCVAAE